MPSDVCDEVEAAPCLKSKSEKSKVHVKLRGRAGVETGIGKWIPFFMPCGCASTTFEITSRVTGHGYGSRATATRENAERHGPRAPRPCESQFTRTTWSKWSRLTVKRVSAHRQVRPQAPHTLWLADGDAALPLVCLYTFYRESQCHGIHSLLSHVRSSPQHLTPHFSWQQRVQVDRVAQRLLEEVVTRRRCPERAAAGALRRRSRRREPRRHGGACRHLDGSGRATAEGS